MFLSYTTCVLYNCFIEQSNMFKELTKIGFFLHRRMCLSVVACLLVYCYFIELALSKSSLFGWYKTDIITS